MKRTGKNHRPISTRLSSETIKAIKTMAERENRSLANMVEEIVRRYLAQAEAK